MEKITINKMAFILDETERHKLLQCLAYCTHRLDEKKHINTGLYRAGITKEFVNYLQLNI